MNRHFRNMHSHPVDVCSRFSLTSQGSFLEYFERQCMTVELSGSVVLFHNRRYFSRMYMWRRIFFLTCWCTGWLKIKFDLRSGSHALHIDIIHLPGFVKHRHCGVSFFGPNCHDGPPLSWKGIRQTTLRRSLDHKPRPILYSWGSQNTISVVIYDTHGDTEDFFLSQRQVITGTTAW